MAVITIIKHPQSGTYYIGQPLIVEADGFDLNYQWQVKNGANWEDISGATATIYYPSVAGSYEYRVRVYNHYAQFVTEDGDAIITEAGDNILIHFDGVSEEFTEVADIEILAVEKDYGNVCVAYIKSSVDFATKGYSQFEDYSILRDIQFANKSSILIADKPDIENDDFVILKKGNKQMFFGICEDYSSNNESGYTIKLRQAECLFDRQVFIGNDSVIKSTGIEDYIKNVIESNWIDSGDELLDKTYISVTVSTHTKLDISVDDEENVFNLMEFLSRAKELYGIFLEFSFTDSVLNIRIYNDTATALPIDVTISDVNGYTEVYNVDVLAKLITKWFAPTSGQTTTLTYYLKTDGTITDDGDDTDRAQGIVKSIYIENDSEDEVIQSIADEFKSNKFEHKISFSLSADSMAYPIDNYYVGRNATIKTKTGIKTSLVTSMAFSSESAFVSFGFGKLKISLIDKIRSLKEKK